MDSIELTQPEERGEKSLRKEDMILGGLEVNNGGLEGLNPSMITRKWEEKMREIENNK